jgi:hypothetical protein
MAHQGPTRFNWLVDIIHIHCLGWSRRGRPIGEDAIQLWLQSLLVSSRTKQRFSALRFVVALPTDLPGLSYRFVVRNQTVCHLDFSSYKTLMILLEFCR